MASTGTVSDTMRHALGGDAAPGSKSIMDLLNAALAGDIQKYGYGYAVVKNWGAATDCVTQARRKHAGVVVATDVRTTVQDAELPYWSTQP